MNRALKLRLRRGLRLKKRQVEELSLQAEAQFERNFFHRLERLREVRRFVIGWLLLTVLLSGCVVAQISGLGNYYQTLQPAPGGTFTEGILGAYTNANPIYATGPVDTAVAKLIFAGLLTYNDKNQLIGDLADSWTSNERGTVYTVHLRPNLFWQDGQPLTAEDVVFTYQTIQNPDAQSPLISSWRGIKVAAPDPSTVTFTLPNTLSSFPYSLTTGILPKHLLGKAAIASLRTNDFNTSKLVGAGPFNLQAVEVSGSAVETRQEQIAMKPFDKYYGGKPHLNGFVVRSYRDKQQLIASFKKQEINAMAGLTSTPSELRNQTDVRIYNLPLTAGVMTFFRTTSGLLTDVKIRQALVRATDTGRLIQTLDYPTLPVREPLLHNQLGFNPNFAQAGFDLTGANALLDSDGWTMHPDGIRYNAQGAPLTFKLYAPDDSEYGNVAHALAKQWRAIGVKADVMLLDSTNFQTTVAFHSYDALLYGISFGVDPDEFVYWDSTQADVRASNRLNFSEYKSPVADAALEAGRTRLDPALRVIKYQPFLQAWQSDAPAVGLYQPRYLYISHGPIYGLDEHAINSDTERFNNVANWMIRTQRASEQE